MQMHISRRPRRQADAGGRGRRNRLVCASHDRSPHLRPRHAAQPRCHSRRVARRFAVLRPRPRNRQRLRRARRAFRASAAASHLSAHRPDAGRAGQHRRLDCRNERDECARAGAPGRHCTALAGHIRRCRAVHQHDPHLAVGRDARPDARRRVAVEIRCAALHLRSLTSAGARTPRPATPISMPACAPATRPGACAIWRRSR